MAVRDNFILLQRALGFMTTFFRVQETQNARRFFGSLIALISGWLGSVRFRFGVGSFQVRLVSVRFAFDSIRVRLSSILIWFGFDLVLARVRLGLLSARFGFASVCFRFGLVSGLSWRHAHWLTRAVACFLFLNLVNGLPGHPPDLSSLLDISLAALWLHGTLRFAGKIMVPVNP